VSDDILKLEIEWLLDREKSGEELDKQPPIQVINDFVRAQIEYFNGTLKACGTQEKPETENWTSNFDKPWKA